MNKKIKEKAPEILKMVQEADSILLTFHVNPDEDSYGSTLAFYHVLKAMGKHAMVIKGDNDLVSSFAALPGYTNITEKNFFELDFSQYDLFIVLDSSAPDRISRLDSVVFPDTMQSICIDHHPTNTNFCDINLICSEEPAVALMLYDLFTAWNIKIDKDVATCLLVGIYGDTGNFTNSNTTPASLAAAATLTEMYPDALTIARTIRRTTAKEVLLLRQKALESLETFLHDTVALVSVSYKTLTDIGIKQEHIDKAEFSSMLAEVPAWPIGIAFLEIQPHRVRVSLRSSDPKQYNVANIAKALGGGGHDAAAGIIFEHTSLDEAKQKVIQTIETTFS